MKIALSILLSFFLLFSCAYAAENAPKDALIFCEQFTSGIIEFSDYSGIDLYKKPVTNQSYSGIGSLFDWGAGMLVLDDTLGITRYHTNAMVLNDEEEDIIVDMLRTYIAMTCLEADWDSELLYDLRHFPDEDYTPYLMYYVDYFDKLFGDALSDENIAQMRDDGERVLIYSGRYSYYADWVDDENLGSCIYVWAFLN